MTDGRGRPEAIGVTLYTAEFLPVEHRGIIQF